jgi:very-short-patch-repair endonuclease
VNGSVGGYEVDFLWPAERLAVETDGREDHFTPIAFEEDRAGDARLTALGYQVRFTYRQLKREPNVVASLLGSLLQPELSINSTR